MPSLFPTGDHDQILRIKRFLVAFLSYLIWSIICVLGYWVGFSTVPYWLLVSGIAVMIALNLALYAAFRTGFNKRFSDPSLTLPQIVIATFWIMVVVYFADEARGAAVLMYMVVLVFGFFRLRIRQFLALSVFAWVGYSAVILLLLETRPNSLNKKVDVFNIVVLALVLPSFSMIGGYISNLRSRIARALSTIERLTNNIQDVVFVADLNMKYTYVSPSVKAMRGYEPEEALKQTLPELFASSSVDAGMRAISDIFALEQSPGDDPVSRTLPLEIKRRDGTGVWTETRFSLVRDKGGRTVGVLGVSRDITERRLAEEKIQHLATHDPLTGLPNRTMFGHLLNQTIKSARRHRRQFAVLFLDLDRFKTINDTMGHDVGDRVLMEMAKRFRQSLRSVDVVGRLGGDEFVILVDEITESNQPGTVAQRVLKAAVEPMVMKGEDCRVTVSIGISLYPKDGEDEETLMKNADMAMYFAKEEGKSNYRLYSEATQRPAFERLSIESNLRRALERNELRLDYQARLDCKSGVITGAEALLRWESQELGSVAPSQFIPVAEETGMIVLIGKWAMRTACAQNAAWQRQGLPPIRMAVNLSLRQLVDEHIIEDVGAALNESSMAPEFLELDISESALFHGPESLMAVLARIKELGVHLTLDDFGTGYSSLAQFKPLPVDTLKVDGSFIQRLPRDPESRAAVEAIIAMGRTLGLTVVAEGVETMAQDHFLRERICDEMQGFYYGKPVGPAPFADLLRKGAKRG